MKFKNEEKISLPLPDGTFVVCYIFIDFPDFTVLYSVPAIDGHTRVVVEALEAEIFLEIAQEMKRRQAA